MNSAADAEQRALVPHTGSRHRWQLDSPLGAVTFRTHVRDDQQGAETATQLARKRCETWLSGSFSSTTLHTGDSNHHPTPPIKPFAARSHTCDTLSSRSRSCVFILSLPFRAHSLCASTYINKPHSFRSPTQPRVYLHGCETTGYSCSTCCCYCICYCCWGVLCVLNPRNPLSITSTQAHACIKVAPITIDNHRIHRNSDNHYTHKCTHAHTCAHKHTHTCTQLLDISSKHWSVTRSSSSNTF